MKRLLIILIFGGIFLTACNDPWEDRFNTDLQTNQTVWELLNQDPDYTDFVQLLIETGYDTILQRNTVFTVFIPEKSSLETLSSLSTEEKISLMGFHISNSIVYSSDVKGVTAVKSLNGKQLFLDVMADGILLNKDTRLLQADIRAINGVIHEIEKVQEIQSNIMELIQNDEAFSHIEDFILEGSDVFFDEANSIQIGIDSIGQTIYDSVWISTNDFFSKYADMSSEDEFFTVILADDNTLDTTQNGELANGYLATLPRYIYRGILTEEEIYSGPVSVGGSIMSFPADKFVFYANASNGQIFKLKSIDDLNIPLTVIWEFTEVSDFDSIRGVKTVDYKPFIDQLEQIRVSGLDGEFVDFKYEKKSGLSSGDQLKVLIEGGTDVNISFDLKDILPGKYRLSINALIRVTDGVVYDAYLNGKLISSNNDFNGGLYKNLTREIGTVIIDEPAGNVFTIDIKDSSSIKKYCFIDFLLFEPIK